MDLGLKDKVAWVSAASQGLGKACALALALEGCKVVMAARKEDVLRAAAEEVRGRSGSDVLAIPCDLVRGEEIDRLARLALERFGTVHAVVTNVGHPRMGSFEELSDDDWRTGFESVLMPAVRLCRLALPSMQRQRWGRIVHVTSVAVKEPGSPYLVSSVFRAGVAALAKSMSREFGPSGILVNTVCPGPFRTPLGAELARRSAQQSGRSLEEVEAETARATALGRIGEAAELAAAVAFLCSEKASDVTGQAIAVDGGMVRSLY
ncbi:MAG: SDR family oxidoreductase [Planctomycetes bacterium]|nr:SDR family oxidoreductase [Planctomycetota bacterium]